MKLRHLLVKKYKNLRDCEIQFQNVHPLIAVIGNNGSGKSNLIEAILHILIGAYFEKAPPFDFRFQFEAQAREVVLEGNDGKLSVSVDGEPKPLRLFAERLRDGVAQVYYPEAVFVYYSGECRRVRQLINRYQRHFERLTRKPETDKHRPLFVQSSNEQSQIILLALFAHGHTTLLDRLGIKDLVNVSLVLRSPQGFDPTLHEPKLWNTVGAARRVLGAIDETAFMEDSVRHTKQDSIDIGATNPYGETRTYRFSDSNPRQSIRQLADRLAKGGDNLFLALEHLRVRGMFDSVSFQLRGQVTDLFEYEHLSEGEKQLLAVIGALHLINRHDTLVLLDEPDTHLNPKWAWDYPSMLMDALGTGQNGRSTVLLTTHAPVLISGLTKEQVLLAHLPSESAETFRHPRRHPRGQGVANLLCSSEFFGLPSSLDKETQKLLDERLKLIMKDPLTEADKGRLRHLNKELQIITPGVSERDPLYAQFLRQHFSSSQV